MSEPRCVTETLVQTGQCGDDRRDETRRCVGVAVEPVRGGQLLHFDPAAGEKPPARDVEGCQRIKATVRRVCHQFPVPVVTDGQGLNITVVSYLDRLDFGFIVDRELVDDVWDLADMHVDEIEPPAAPNGPNPRRLPSRDAAERGGLPRRIRRCADSAACRGITRPELTLMPSSTRNVGVTPITPATVGDHRG